MNLLSRSSLGLALAAVIGACGPSQEPGQQGAAEASVFPVTTASDAARQHYEAGRLQLGLGRPQKALEHFRLAVAEDSGFAVAHLGVSNAVASTEETRASLEQAEALLESVTDAERLLVQISRAGIDNDSDLQLALAEALVEQYPESATAWSTLAGIQGARNEIEASRTTLERAVGLDADDVLVNAGLLFSYLFIEPYDYDRARMHAEKIVELVPDEPMSYSLRGDVRRAQKDLEGARSEYTMAVEKDPTLTLATLKRGIVGTLLGNLDAAREDYRASAEGSTGVNRITYANFGAFVHLLEGNPEAAISELDAIDAAGAPDVPEDQLRGARTFTLSNMATIALHHSTPDVAARVGDLVTHLRADASASGDSEFERLQEATIRLWEGRLAARTGDYDTAAAKAGENRELLAGDANPRKLEPYHQLLGLIELERGNYADAVAHYEQANTLAPYVKYHLALAHEGAGQADLARARYLEIVNQLFVGVGSSLVRQDAIKKTS